MARYDESDPSANKEPVAGAEETQSGEAQVTPSELQARLEKRDEVFGSPMVQRRHQTALIVKKIELSPGEKAALGRGGLGKRILLTIFLTLLVVGGVSLVYRWMAPPPVTPLEDPGRVSPVAQIPAPQPAETPVTSAAPVKPQPPAFPALNLVFAGAMGKEEFTEAVAPVAGWRIEGGFLIEPPRPDLTPTWLKAKYSGDLDVEWLVAVEAVPGSATEGAEAGTEPVKVREFRVIFGDRLNQTIRVQICVPSRLGHNYGDVLDEAGTVTASYGHNRYGWPFEDGTFYRLKISRRGEKWIVSRDGEFIFAFFRPAGDCLQIGYVPVTGARLQSIQIQAK